MLQRALLERVDIDPAEVGEVVVGCVHRLGEQMYNIARNAWLQKGLPIETPAITVERQCGSGQSAVAIASAMVASVRCARLNRMSALKKDDHTEIPSAPVRFEVEDGVGLLTLASSGTHNALDEAMLAGLDRCSAEAVDSSEAEVIVLRGEGPTFSVGGSIPMFVAAGDKAHDLLLRIGKWLNPTVQRLHESPKIVVSAVRGAVAGGAIGLMAASDLVLAAEDSIFVLGYASLATTPDAGTSWFLARDVGYRRALELYLTNERVEARRALSLGIVNRVVPGDELDAATIEFAERIRSGPGVALREGKRLFRQAAESHLQAQLDDEIRTFADNATRSDFRESVLAFAGGEARGGGDEPEDSRSISRRA